LDGLDVTVAARKVNERQPAEAVKFISQAFYLRNNRKPTNIILAGLTFKGYPETDDLRGSMSLVVLEYLRKEFPDAKFSGYDPQLEQQTIESLNLGYVPDITKTDLETDLIIISNNHPSFKKLSWFEIFDRGNESLLVYDFWNNYNSFDAEELNNRYIVLGNHTAYLKHVNHSV